MFFALLALVAALQTQSSTPQVSRVALTPPRPAAEAPPAATAPTAEPEPEAEPAAEPRTREVCRYVEVTGQRFPQRRCRTVVIDD